MCKVRYRQTRYFSVRHSEAIAWLGMQFSGEVASGVNHEVDYCVVMVESGRALLIVSDYGEIYSDFILRVPSNKG